MSRQLTTDWNDFALDRATYAAIDAEYGAPVKESQASSIVGLVKASGALLWHTPTNDGYISIPVGCHYEHHALNSRS
jgi:hypothetical protein